MQALVIMHVESEGPGRLGARLRAGGARLDFVRMHRHGVLPLYFNGYDAVLSLGGPMSVADPDYHAFLVQERLLHRRAITAGAPALGVCLGAQLIAGALGAKVTRAPHKELGFSPVTLTAAGRADPLFQGLPPVFPVLQWHEDTFELPPGAVLLATNDLCPHQAFRCNNAYGLQFHLEMDRDMVADWTGQDETLRFIRQEYETCAGELARLADLLGDNFLAAVVRQEKLGG